MKWPAMLAIFLGGSMVRFIILLSSFCITIVIAATSSANTNAFGECPNVHWRERAYDNVIMKKYKPYVHCVEWTAWQFRLPEELMYSVLYHERGRVDGKCSTNSNRTTDCGPGQINDVRMPELTPFGLTRDDIRTVPCRNIWAVGFLLHKEIKNAKGDFWLGVGNYHAKHHLKPKTHAAYVRNIYDAWQKLIGSMSRC
ncbi:TPA: lytic transglycosylase domain-containing protein [Aeromonas hydrophila subsp. hydrophila]